MIYVLESEFTFFPSHPAVLRSPSHPRFSSSARHGAVFLLALSTTLAHTKPHIMQAAMTTRIAAVRPAKVIFRRTPRRCLAPVCPGSVPALRGAAMRAWRAPWGLIRLGRGSEPRSRCPPPPASPPPALARAIRRRDAWGPAPEGVLWRAAPAALSCLTRHLARRPSPLILPPPHPRLAPHL